jgi:hypothetical protein
VSAATDSTDPDTDEVGPAADLDGVDPLGDGDTADATEDTADATEDTAVAAEDSHTDPDTTDLVDGADTADTAESTDSDPDTTITDTRADTETISCGSRECGTFHGQNCGSCSVKPGTVCGPGGRCEVPRGPLGSFCGITALCNPTSADFPSCIDNQCASGLCLSQAQGGRFVFAIFRDWSRFFSNSVCTASCLIFIDNNHDGVNDPAQDDCQPSDVANGPAGNRFRCVNFARLNANPVGLCVPGTTFAACSSNRDCPVGEGCEVTSILGEISTRCVANYRAGDWGGATVGLGGACNDDPAQGPVNFCASGYCDTFGCAPTCAGDRDCDTTPGPGVCAAGTCTDRPDTPCTTDLDCSTFRCGTVYFSDDYSSFRRCAPKN